MNASAEVRNNVPDEIVIRDMGVTFREYKVHHKVKIKFSSTRKS